RVPRGREGVEGRHGGGRGVVELGRGVGAALEEVDVHGPVEPVGAPAQRRQHGRAPQPLDELAPAGVLGGAGALTVAAFGEARATVVVHRRETTSTTYATTASSSSGSSTAPKPGIMPRPNVTASRTLPSL